MRIDPAGGKAPSGIDAGERAAADHGVLHPMPRGTALSARRSSRRPISSITAPAVEFAAETNDHSRLHQAGRAFGRVPVVPRPQIDHGVRQTALRRGR